MLNIFWVYTILSKICLYKKKGKNKKHTFYLHFTNKKYITFNWNTLLYLLRFLCKLTFSLPEKLQQINGGHKGQGEPAKVHGQNIYVEHHFWFCCWSCLRSISTKKGLLDILPVTHLIKCPFFGIFIISVIYFILGQCSTYKCVCFLLGCLECFHI